MLLLRRWTEYTDSSLTICPWWALPSLICCIVGIWHYGKFVLFDSLSCKHLVWTRLFTLSYKLDLHQYTYLRASIAKFNNIPCLILVPNPCCWVLQWLQWLIKWHWWSAPQCFCVCYSNLVNGPGGNWVTTPRIDNRLEWLCDVTSGHTLDIILTHAR